MAKKVEVRTQIFDRLWRDMEAQLKELKPELKHAIDFEQNKTGSCDILAQILNKDRCKGNTIYKEYFTPYTQAKKNSQPTFQIRAHFLEWLTELVHGQGATFEQFYLNTPNTTQKFGQTAQQLLNSYSLSIEQQQLFWKYMDDMPAAEEQQSSLICWFRGQIWLKRLVYFGGIMALLSLVGVLGMGVLAQQVDISQEKLIQGMQFIWILLAAVFVFQHSSGSQHLDSPTFARASNSQNRLLTYWLRLWGAWFMLYTLWFLQGFLNLNDLQNNWYNLGVHTINLATALYIYLMYLEMSKETEHQEQHLHISMKYYVFLIGYVFTEALIIHISPQYSNLFSIFSGLFTAIATFLLVSRLSSKILDVPTSFINFLVLYAAIQPLIPYIIEPNTAHLSQETRTILATFLTIFAFIAKIVLLLLFAWLQDSYRLLHYMLRIYHVNTDEMQMRQLALRYFEKRYQE